MRLSIFETNCVDLASTKKTVCIIQFLTQHQMRLTTIVAIFLLHFETIKKDT
jgi:hypothetical protein